MASPRACWCGNTDLRPFAPQYTYCAACGTLVSCVSPAPEVFDVHDDAVDFYGREYWWSHQQRDLGLPDIAARARTDLPERCLYWLRTLLAYRPPPARVLELGAAHGAYVALLGWAGFEAAGLELSPSVVAQARAMFGVHMLRGRVETQALAPGSYDVIVMNDVVEHLPDPKGTLNRCVDLLAPDGLLVVQMPRYDEPRSYAAMRQEDDRFLRHVERMGMEHQHLFSQRAATRLFGELGLAHVAFEPPMFAYDMFVIASRRPFARGETEQGMARLLASPSGRMVAALLDADAERTVLRTDLATANEDRAQRLVNIQTLDCLLAARLDDVESLRAQLTAAQARHAALSEQLADRDREVDGLHQIVERARDLVRHPAVRTLTRLGVTREVHDRFDAALLDSMPSTPLIAVDLAPILSGSQNGGAKRLVLELLDGLSADRRHRYLLLTTADNHESFAKYEASGMRRLRWPADDAAVDESTAHPVRADRRRPLAREGVKLLFCPMTDPLHAEPGIPTVSIVYDLQHMAYPHFFTPVEREHRDAVFQRVKTAADAVVCISEFTRTTLGARLGVAPERAVTIPIAVPMRRTPIPAERLKDVRQRYGLSTAPIALYPANFWPHKNHRLLLVALAAFFRQRPSSPLHVALVGNVLEWGDEIRNAIEGMGLASRVHVLGYIPDEDLAVLWTGAWCLLYPSLHEGFGIPIIEAMRFGTPVICSDVASLPEVAGSDGALYIDPRKPETIVAALARLEDVPSIGGDLVDRARTRLDRFQPEAMVARYLAVFDQALARGGQAQVAQVVGLFGDRWLSPVVLALSAASSHERRWEMDVTMPTWHPRRRARVRVTVNGRPAQAFSLARGASRQLVVPVPRERAEVRLDIGASFVPTGNGDMRELTVLASRVRLVDVTSGSIAYDI